MRDLFIGKAVAYAAKTGGGTIGGAWESVALVDGGIAMLDNGGTIIAANASAITSKYITLITTGATAPKTSFPIYKSGFSYSKQAYVAPVAATKFLGSEEAAAAGNNSLNLPGTLPVGSVVGVGIVNLGLPTEDQRRYRFYEHTVVSGDVMTGKAATNVIAKLVAKINADVNRCVTALAHEDGSDNIDGIKFTAKTAGVDFELFHVGDVLKDADITNGTANNPGQGTLAQVLEMAKANAYKDGNHLYMKYQHLLFTEPSQTVTGATYTTYVLNTVVPNTDVISQSNKPNLTLIIAVPSGQTGGGEIVTVLDALLAKV
jgi:hypothetical protein